MTCQQEFFNDDDDRTADVSGIPSEVLRHFEAYTFKTIEAGYNRFSADAVLHRIRWFMQIERGNREFKCNNNWTSTLARWFMKKHPEHDGFFETRILKREK